MAVSGVNAPLVASSNLTACSHAVWSWNLLLNS